MRNTLKLAISIVVCFLTGGVGTIFTNGSLHTWYPHLVKPFFSPPNSVFGPVWTILYLLMGISFYLIWKKGNKIKKVREAMIFFGIQLGINAIWTPIFFGAHNILLALVVILILWIFILKTILSFSKINKTASYLLYPYILWVSFAAILNFSLWLLNR